ncbi:S49 family peptidase [Parvibaculum sp.]|uniref:S49 family peptidase n=1 Tax=Parvibaculum sp. TaxID=2024848 RepID=UPI000C603A64|nr:S49 family peptidase [Parvibaculum sp.]MAM95685.1 serine peptidase [Parvibaculum sp.]|tara:strand:- start:13588 stop:14445 length:858 start_codon:yes stop_codon:yes gene_type:complete
MNSLVSTSPRPALLHEGYALQLQRVAEFLRAPEKHGMSRFTGAREGQDKPFGYRDGIAVIGVQGCLIDKMGWWGSSWATGYNVLKWQLTEAHEDTEVKGIALDIDSYGGPVSACFDFCDFAMEAKAASGKPVAAILTECAYSAGYAVASTADTIAVPRTGGVGSIGVVTTHWDLSGMLEKYGEKVTVIPAGKHKADGNPYGPLPDDVLARISAEVEDLRQLFAATVVRNRAGAPIAPALDQVLATEARTYSGPAQLAEAVKLGLADAIMAPADAFSAFAEHVNAA